MPNPLALTFDVLSEVFGKIGGRPLIVVVPGQNVETSKRGNGLHRLVVFPGALDCARRCGEGKRPKQRQRASSRSTFSNSYNPPSFRRGRHSDEANARKRVSPEISAVGAGGTIMHSPWNGFIEST